MGMKLKSLMLLRKIFTKVGILLGFEVTWKVDSMPFEIRHMGDLVTKSLPFTGIGKSGLIDNLLAAQYVESNSLKGDIVEAGVHMGGSVGLLSLALGPTSSRTIWCYDTFLGMPEPSSNDSKEALALFAMRSRGDGYSD